ncbi:gamma-glutamyl-gamma-aminobutyrate hydrolase family protein [Pseudomonas sp. SK3(2021)]|uniref:gamma-glutamyl-gamma-aminobutyrate hydrolase family protein n=1 Tax=Pseudomonas sp. SK3(2021) TaxID=2841064 RepID=UPI00192BA274|nr:gamma-glutamyl-gamma-aminobutyrate hydrolase family protein [Pseudomonas sp. SK3(2021)]QQZ42188.1 gamma-glutamyl-gamma-aminobutyrate hydrolase family protein [Pseudomonas sp. SK3(2021)]
MRIAITQRVEQVPGYAERRDCLDQRWSVLMEGLGIDLVPVPNGLSSPGGWLARQEVAGLILSGGNDLAHLPNASNCAPERDLTEAVLLRHAQKTAMPVLGVCRGMQVLNHFLGGGLVPVAGHANCIHAVHTEGELFAEYREVNSYHNWGLNPDNLAANLLARVWANDGSVEAFLHQQLPWMAIMWHPERPSNNGIHDVRLIRHFFSGKDIPCASLS